MYILKKYMLSSYIPILSIFIIVGLANFGFCSEVYASAASDQLRANKANVAPKMPFRLGLELQEISGLCAWALDNNSIQKKSIFVVNNQKGKKLWHLEIDSGDIEFVTVPFSSDQRESLGKCIEGIYRSLLILTAMLEKAESVTFSQWIELTQKNLREIGCFLGDGVIKVYEKQLRRPSIGWKAVFNPQVTIQHPLECSIPLYFNLFGFDRPNYTMSFVASLPGLDLLKDAMKKGSGEKYTRIFQSYVNQKIFGLGFLHALTLVQMTPDEDSTDKMLLAETLSSLKTAQQIDVKMKLPLMSRRPFSLMCEQIGFKGEYTKFFFSMFGYNQSFYSSYKVPKLLDRTNYAEQFFDDKTGQKRPRSIVLSYLDEEFLRENQDVVVSLLAQGVVSTTMIRNFKKNISVGGTTIADVFKEYCLYAVKSVDQPEEKNRLILDGTRIFSVPNLYDVLSPPLFQDLTNSMGFFKDTMSEEDSKYGEAIVEVRAIKDISEKFLESAGLGLDRVGIFLTNINGQLTQETIALFDFLDNFGSKNILDFSVGLPYVVLRGNF